MNKFVDNVNKYTSYYGIKQSAISLKANIDNDRLSKILSNKECLCLEDMEKIAYSLGKNIEYFFGDIDLNEIKYNQYPSITFNVENLTKGKEEFTNKVFDFLEHIDAIMGIPKKIEKYSKI